MAKTLVIAFVAVSGLGYGGYKWITPPPQDTTGEENAATEQRTAGWQERRYGRGYVIWEGLIIEELNNNTGFNSYQTDYDMNIYDFDLGIIYHTTNDEGRDGGGIATTYFNDIAVDGLPPPTH